MSANHVSEPRQRARVLSATRQRACRRAHNVIAPAPLTLYAHLPRDPRSLSDNVLKNTAKNSLKKVRSAKIGFTLEL